MSNYVATLTYSAQVTEDSWKIFQQHLKCGSSTTLGEIMAWKASSVKGSTPISLCITELEELLT